MELFNSYSLKLQHLVCNKTQKKNEHFRCKYKETAILLKMTTSLKTYLSKPPGEVTVNLFLFERHFGLKKK